MALRGRRRARCYLLAGARRLLLALRTPTRAQLSVPVFARGTDAVSVDEGVS
ncbi:hypothetical protein DICSQDRAFT_131766 [Dichomitus squalens LYAD-421 SS1]|uniref:uncharacterized protein n=1 Tax=Dichomitus squalens (strain LYAD-421) TaxID=732165 RepID=UPI0004414541|nr:uncharacterized protein DICSQDRAFT_131766 [Dichomitus squalens LYAD-421 SS1]EJF67433.1 hypothetical protein DICSQDRAFT_131766 [Dichomitus squalens LYAD-421 SS1]